MSTEHEHYLTEYLSTALPRLGLDSETYGPYVTGIFPLDLDEYESDVDDDEMNTILELLRSSSETHSDEDLDEWTEFRYEIMKRRDQFLEKALEKKQEETEKQKIETKKKLQLAREEAKQKEIQIANEKKEKGKKNERLIALMDQYGYEKDGDDDDYELNDHKKDSGESYSSKNRKDDSDEYKSNRQVAAESSKKYNEQMRAESSKSFQNKKAAREATNKQKKDKMKVKEERRKRATKGERRS